MNSRLIFGTARTTPARRRSTLLIGTTTAALGALALLASCASPAEDTAGTLSDPQPSETETVLDENVVSGLDAPWSIAFHTETMLISERDTARIIEVTGTGETREVGTITDAVPGGEGGLLGIALRGDHLYAYFTAADDSRVERYPLLGEPANFSLGESEVIIDSIPQAQVHNGGRLAFGPDGMLYVTTGDAGDTTNAQDVDSLGGKILRLTPTGDIPDDNPLSGSPVYSYGHRNPQGIAWDENGTMYSTEFGQNTWDELNVIEAGGNYGWPEVEGIGNEGDYIDPVQQWEPSEASPSGMAIAGDSIFIANLRGERLREVPLSDLGASTEFFVGEHGRLRDVVVAPDGTLRILTNNTDGRGTPRDSDDRLLSLTPNGGSDV